MILYPQFGGHITLNHSLLLFRFNPIMLPQDGAELRNTLHPAEKIISVM